MRGDQAGDLRHGGLGTVDDEGHEEQREGQVLCVEVEDEEVDLARGVVLGEGVGVGKRKGGEESVAV
jgi:stress response protein YsnF